MKPIVYVKPGTKKVLGQMHQSDVLSFLKGLPSNSVDLITTDPAYSGMNQHLKLGKGRIVGEYTKDRAEKWFEEFHDTEENYEIFLNECFRVLKDDRHIFVMFDSYSLISLGQLFRTVFNLKNIITWDKVAIGMGHYFRRQTEFILFGSKGKRPLSSRSIPDVWRLRRLHGAAYPTQKPVELYEAMIASSYLGENKFVVVDPFMGSGSLAIAAIRQNVQFIVNDISPKSLEYARVRVETYLDSGVDIAQKKSSLVDAGLKKFWK